MDLEKVRTSLVAVFDQPKKYLLPGLLVVVGLLATMWLGGFLGEKGKQAAGSTPDREVKLVDGGRRAALILLVESQEFLDKASHRDALDERDTNIGQLTATAIFLDLLRSEHVLGLFPRKHHQGIRELLDLFASVAAEAMKKLKNNESPTLELRKRFAFAAVCLEGLCELLGEDYKSIKKTSPELRRQAGPIILKISKGDEPYKPFGKPADKRTEELESRKRAVTNRPFRRTGLSERLGFRRGRVYKADLALKVEVEVQSNDRPRSDGSGEKQVTIYAAEAVARLKNGREIQSDGFVNPLGKWMRDYPHLEHPRLLFDGRGATSFVLTFPTSGNVQSEQVETLRFEIYDGAFDGGDGDGKFLVELN